MLCSLSNLILLSSNSKSHSCKFAIYNMIEMVEMGLLGTFTSTKQIIYIWLVQPHIFHTNKLYQTKVRNHESIYKVLY